ncbi:MAG TPA: FHA domain-containing protein [Solirubrobacteraceae bacterium]|jgi:DNA-directed RNA polymerase subunit RPC12/RpoP|nr:FHA domain-containing protein [Solirubrobacteraceae bacterium]
MEPLISGTIAATGSFRCEKCGYVLSLAAVDSLTDCPDCGARAFVRASLFSAPAGGAPLVVDDERDRLLADGRGRIDEPGEYLVYEADGETCVAALTGDWTRIGRSLAANVRFDDPTVSRRHALIVHTPEGAQVLDDRSLNGVFVNGTRVTHATLTDGDEIVVGRYRLQFLVVSDVAARSEAAPTTA